MKQNKFIGNSYNKDSQSPWQENSTFLPGFVKCWSLRIIFRYYYDSNNNNIFIGIIIAISIHGPLKILVKLMPGTVNGDPLKSFKQHSKILKGHLQEPLPDLKDLTINI